MGEPEHELLGSGRFRLIRSIGEGGMGVVYEAEDLQRRQLVALKTLKHQDVDTLYRLKREFRSLADISHPNLVDLYDMVVDGDTAFFTMELVEGTDLIGYCRPTSARRPHSTVEWDADTPPAQVASEAPKASASFDTQRLRAVLPQLARGLLALHEAGMVHRDIKPSNVLVTHSGRVVLLDFGLVADLHDWSRDSLSGRIVGTVEYMAPEQAGAERAAPAGDWYSVGVLIYEALTGRLPHEGAPMQVLLGKQNPPLPPRDLVDEIPEELDALCEALLRPDPAARPGGREVLRRLGGLDEDEEEAASVAAGPVTDLAPFTGREREIEILESALSRVEQGEPSAALIRGPSGIGKSALVRTFLDRLRVQNPELVLLGGRCFQSEVVPYKAIDAVIDELSRYWSQLSQEEAALLVPPEAALLPRLFPVLGRVPVIAAVPRREAPPDPQELQARAVRALRRVFTEIARRNLLVLFLDDLQWGDAASLGLLADLLRPPDPPPLFLILSTRDEGATGEHDPRRRSVAGPLDALMSKLAVPREILDLGPLSAEDATELARHLLPEQTPRLASRIAEESAGVPFFVAEIAVYLQTVEAEKTEGFHLDQVLAERIALLPESARALIELVAVAGEPISQRVAASALGVSAETMARVLRQLRTAHLLRAPGGRATDRVECYHNRIRESVRASLSQEQAREHHRSLAIALEQWDEASPERMVLHWDGAGEGERAAEYARRAAREAAETYDFERAARLYEMALSLGRFGEEGNRSLRTALAEALAEAGRPREAARAFSAAADGAEEIEALELKTRSAISLLRGGYLSQGLAALEQLFRQAGLRFPRTSSAAARSLVRRRLWIRLRGLWWRTRSEGDLTRRALARIDLCSSAAIAFGGLDLLRGATLQARGLALALRYGEPTRVARALALEAGYLAARGAYKRADRVAEMSEELAAQHGAGALRPFTEWARGAILLFRDSAWRRALEHFRAGEALLHEHHMASSWEMHTVQYYLSVARLQLGALSELQESLPRYIDTATRRGDNYTSVTLRTRFSILWLCHDDPEGAERDLEDALAAWIPYQEMYLMQHLRGLLGLCEVDLYRGEPERARERFAAEEPAIVASGLLRAGDLHSQVAFLRGRVAVAEAARSEGEAREQALSRARRFAGELERASSPIGRTSAELVRAGEVRRRGQSDYACAILRQAIEDLEALDSLLYANAARRQLGELVGGSEGERMAQSSDEWFRAQGVARPEPLCAMLVPL